MTERTEAPHLPLPLLERAREAALTRESWSGFTGRTPAGPSWDDAVAWLAAAASTTLDLGAHPGIPAPQHDEISPYTGEPLGLSYPRATVEELTAAAVGAAAPLAATPVAQRLEACLRILERLFDDNNLLGVAAMHTTGQGRGMSLSGSGTNALDRGLEAVAQASAALERVPRTARWSGSFGAVSVDLDKTYRVVPLGPAVVVACASFPAWNVYPAVLANLATGNPVILKPHPSSVLQMALAARAMREVLAECGLDPDAVLLAVDTADEPMTTSLVTAPAVRIVDFTGSAQFGAWVERHATQARVYTETSGLNAVVIESFADPDAEIRAIAGAVCLFSAQMCTAPQNVFVPAAGVRTPAGAMSADEVIGRLTAAIDDIMAHPRRAAAVAGAIQSARTVAEVTALAGELGDAVVATPRPYPHPEFPAARTLTPLVAVIDADDRAWCDRERFGPVSFVIRSADAASALERAATDAATHGAISAFVYSTDDDFVAEAEERFARAGAALTVNVTGPMPINFSAAFSDFHVTGLNPAGTATLTDDAFVAGRFRVAQSRRPASLVPTS